MSTGPAPGRGPVLSLRGAGLRYGEHEVWRDLDLDVHPGELVAVLGPNGSGKTSLVRAVLGQQPLTDGSVEVQGRAPRAGSASIGYVPQQRLIDPMTPLRARDLVRQGIDGHRWGVPLPSRKVRTRVDDLLASVGATAYGDVPVGLLSGGEQQRIRIAQAVATDPALLLCDEPLLSLDLAHQREVVGVVDSRRRTGTAVLFVTHEINPVLDVVDKVLYLAPAGHRVGTPDEVLTSESLTELYGTRVEVLRHAGRVLIAATGEHVSRYGTRPSADHAHHPHDEERPA
ncbi:metal ABC transporter ATP-binding protein [Quadrisphaera oryzae]|uniref:metal ABC transporter ATP-binding protein n=1 Tax=Quadrisphaera TaxID=317661 RepID=UPI00164959F1|nr:ABC transporter ATP-binding protein [Quadrisphaera sp. RL12-1S]